jgi:rhodanese-related sulfurtransferase
LAIVSNPNREVISLANLFKKLFGEKKVESKPVMVQPQPEPEPEQEEIQFDPAKHIINPVQLKEYIEQKKKVLLIDVREPHELKHGRLQGIKHIPMNSLPMEIDKLDKNAETVVICEHGIRSLDCTFFLVQNGFTDVKSLDGGMANWYYKNESAFIEKG